MIGQFLGDEFYWEIGQRETRNKTGTVWSDERKTRFQFGQRDYLRN